MRLLHIAFVFLGCCGMALLVSCGAPGPEKPKTVPPPPAFEFSTSLSIAKVNGVPTEISIRWPRNELTVKNKADLEIVAKSLEVMVADLKGVSDQMEINEKPPQKPIEMSNGQAKSPGKEKAS